MASVKRRFATSPGGAYVGTNPTFTPKEALVELRKFGNDACASALAGAQGYRAAMEELLPLAAGSANLLVRHLVMPGHLDCCTGPGSRSRRRS